MQRASSFVSVDWARCNEYDISVVTVSSSHVCSLCGGGGIRIVFIAEGSGRSLTKEAGKGRSQRKTRVDDPQYMKAVAKEKDAYPVAGPFMCRCKRLS